ncbi:hypothetical protein Verru16b_00746 [Lacunisphaera limnophila]|uniref:DUF4097 domain-containing protein n=1 Tax=Lacunisphaera limnophila TaxID=1838286 RepID=A0A1D8AS15_9BACT|nr:DUF4097 family beta strand repeat-containing protein [Lacunisphaera limnophila]AOS43693.1 hypothetical protein Verru16b_00746 [Lacunisphaera limnophila]
MKYFLPLLTFGLFLVSPGLLEAKIIRTVEKTFSVQPGGQLKAATQGGNITIRTADIPEVRVLVKQVIRASTEAEADEILAKLSLTLTQSGNDVTAEAKYEKRVSGSWFGNWPPVSVSFEVTVPSHYNLTLNTSGGDIAVASVQGDVRARTSGGNLAFERIDGDIDAGTSGGDITIKEGTARAKLHTSGGNITVDRAGGPTEVSTSGGDITLRSVARLISASTSGGDVRAVITEPLTQDTELGTSGGDVEVSVQKNAGFHLDASTSGGDVKASGLTITLEQGGSGKHKLVGAVNGGGPRLKLRSSGGDIVVRTN